jgi:hypothetical protein
MPNIITMFLFQLKAVLIMNSPLHFDFLSVSVMASSVLFELNATALGSVQQHPLRYRTPTFPRLLHFSETNGYRIHSPLLPLDLHHHLPDTDSPKTNHTLTCDTLALCKPTHQVCAHSNHTKLF